MKTLLAAAICLCIATTTNGFLFKRIKTVDQLDLDKYTGRWYSTPVQGVIVGIQMYNSLVQRKTFEKNSFCTTATYTLGADKKTIIVENSGRISDPQGKVNDIEGTAVRPDDHEPGKLIVNFPSSPSPQSTKPNYLVIKLGPVVEGKYAYTIITSNYKAYTWILARDVKVFRAKYEQEALAYLKNNGYNWFWNRPRKVYQEDDCLYPPM